MIRPDTSLWAFSLSFYRHPEVERLCLQLQDQHGINVNSLLWAIWLDQICLVSDMGIWSRGLAGISHWHKMVVVPLRRVRRGISREGILGGLRKRLLSWELMAEKRELTMLEQEALKAPSVQAHNSHKTTHRFLALALEGLIDEQRQLAALFEQWSQGDCSIFSTGEKKPLG
ncbi:MAG: TIGR02444 family protein [Cellvibrionaceae bacterium]